MRLLYNSPEGSNYDISMTSFLFLCTLINKNYYLLRLQDKLLALYCIIGLLMIHSSFILRTLRLGVVFRFIDCGLLFIYHCLVCR